MPRSSLRVLALVTDAFGGHGGIAQYNRDFLSALAGCEGVADVVVLSRAGEASLGDVPLGVRQLRPVPGRLAYSLASLALARRERPISIVFCGHPYMAPLAILIAKLARARLWLQVHGVDAWAELSHVYRRSIEAADLISSVSRYTRRRLLEWCAIDPARVRILSNTVDVRFRPGPKPRFLVERHATSGRKVLLTVSRLASVDRYKGQDQVIRALPRVLLEHPETIYIVVGDGDDRERLEALAAELGVTECVRFAGRVPSEELPDYYHLADLFVMPSTGEGFGIAFLEAMASGIPVIGGNRDGSVDPLGDGRFGAAVDPDDGDALASNICEALRDPVARPERAETFGQKAFAAHVQQLVASGVA
jgi:phosphatidylinositol alpha-1,6-mannosyltransferase